MTPPRNRISSLPFVTVDAVKSEIGPIGHRVFFKVRFARKRPSPDRVRRSEQRRSGPSRVDRFGDRNVKPKIVDQQPLLVSRRFQEVFQLLKFNMGLIRIKI